MSKGGSDMQVSRMGFGIRLKNDGKDEVIAFHHYIDLRHQSNKVQVVFDKRFTDVAAALGVDASQVIDAAVSQLAIPAVAEFTHVPAGDLQLKENSAAYDTVAIETKPPLKFAVSS